MSLNVINNYLIYLILILVFNGGLIELLGFSNFFARLAPEVLVLLLAFNVLLKKLTWPLFTLLCIILLFFIGFSFLLNDVDIISLILFFRRIFLPLLFLLSIKNIKKIESASIDKLLNILFIEQIIASVIKLFIYGQTENYIGTISIYSGELATIFPLMAITFYFTKYLYYANYKYLIICPFFLIISFSSLKLGILIYLPIVLIFNYLLFFINKNKSNRYLFKFFIQILMYSVFAFIAFYFLVRLNPRANVEQKVWGSFNMQYVIDYTIIYTTRDRYVENEQKSGRLTALNMYFSDLKNKTIKNYLFGNGPGSLIKSGFVQSNREDFVDSYGYGSKIGIIWFVEQVGMLGFALYLLVHISVLRVLNNLNNNSYSHIGKIFFIILLLDLFTYSSISIISQFPLIIYFIIVCIANQNFSQIKQQQSNKGTLIT